jgi:hypothetical protein
MFQQCTAIIRGRISSEDTQEICVVDVYGLQFVQCGQLSRDATESVIYYFDAFVGYFITIPQNARPKHQEASNIV